MRTRRSPLLALLLAAALLTGLAPVPARAATTWRYNTYRSAGYLTQNPYSTACTAASVMMMLNFIALSGTGGGGFTWRTSRVKNSPTDYRDMLSILYFERAHDTLAWGRAGSDAHGWRNALNNYGWGRDAMLDAGLRVYDDRAYGSFDTAVRSAVIAIARYHKPVGMLGWAGGHAQVITGYVVSGENPATSTSFTVLGVYLSDPLYKDGIVNKLIGVSQLRSGSLVYRFQAYREIDSPHDDSYTIGWRRSSVQSMTSEWYRRWVLLVPIRNGLPAEPPPDPTPTPTPTPQPSPTPAPTTPPTATPTLTPQPSPTPAPTPAVDAATPTPAATASSSPTPVGAPAGSEPPAVTASDGSAASGSSVP